MMESPELTSLVHDNSSGAREIAARALPLLLRATTHSKATTPSALVDELADVAVKVIRAKPEMAPVFHGLNNLLRDTETAEATADELGPFRIGLLALIQSHINAAPDLIERVAQQAGPLIANGTVLFAHSRSTTVLAALRSAKRQGTLFDLVVGESRPNLEGRAFARELAEDQIPVRVVVDAMAATAVAGADRVLLGADALTPESLVNKVGTYLVALAAKDAGVPVSVLADTTKAWTRRLDPQLGLLTGRNHDPREVWDSAPYGVEVVNLYFDRTPLSLVTDVVDESGIHTPAAWWTGIQSRGYARRLEAAFPGELL